MIYKSVLLLIGKPTSEEVVQSIRDHLGADVETSERSSFFSSRTDIVANVRFSLLNGLGKVIISEDNESHKHVHPDSTTMCTMDMTGASAELMKHIWKTFGGYLLLDDSRDNWVFHPAVSSNLSPEDAFISSMKGYLPDEFLPHLRKAVADPYIVEALGSAVDELREAKEERAPGY